MSRDRDGGPAFPCVEHPTRDGEFVGSGMSLRDYFAAQALSAVAATNPNSRADIWAMEAYEVADAMMMERAKSSQQRKRET